MVRAIIRRATGSFAPNPRRWWRPAPRITRIVTHQVRVPGRLAWVRGLLFRNRVEATHRASLATPRGQTMARGAMRGTAGMGLIEVIVGIGLVALCLIGLNALVVTMIRGNLTSQLIDQATRLADARMDELRSAGYDNVPLGTTTDRWRSATAGSGVRFDRTTVVTAGPLTNTRTLTVTMQWNDHGPRAEVFSTEISK
jgi:type II secretory pathway pseudopilin PulG